MVLSYRIWESLSDDCERIAKILHIYAQASPIVREVTPIRNEKNAIFFRIYTNIPSDNFPGHKNFIVSIRYPVSHSYVEILDDEKVISKVSLEAGDDHSDEVIIRNFIEIAELYDDPIIQHIISKHGNVSSPGDIRKLIQLHDTSH